MPDPISPEQGAGKISRRNFLLMGLSVLATACTEKIAVGAPNGGETAIRKATSTQRVPATATPGASATQGGTEATKNPATAIATNPATTPGKSETPKTPKATVTPITTEELQNCPPDVLKTAASMTSEQIKENAATPYFFTEPAKVDLSAHLFAADEVLGKYLSTTVRQTTQKTVYVSPYLREQMTKDFGPMLEVKNIVLQGFPEGAKSTMAIDGLSIVTSIWPEDGLIANLIDRPKATPRSNAEGAAYWLNGYYKWMPTDQTKNPGYYTVPNSWDSHWVAVFDEKDKTKSCGKALVKVDDKGKVLVFDPNKFVTGQEKAEDVWITEADPLNISTWPKERQEYWEDVSKRPVNPRKSYDPKYYYPEPTPTPTAEDKALEEQEKKIESLDNEFTDKFWTPTTEAFLKKQGIDVNTFKFGRTLDRQTMLTWGLIKWQQDHLQDYRDGKITLENWLLKIPPSVIRRLVQDQYNYTVSYQEKIEGTRQPKLHDGLAVKYNYNSTQVSEYMPGWNAHTRITFPIFGADLIGKNWPSFITGQYLGDLSGLFLLPGKKPTDQIGALSGNEGQPGQGIGLFPFTVTFKDRTEDYRFPADSKYFWEKLDKPVTAYASHPYNTSEPVKLESIIATLGGKVRIDSIETMGGQMHGYIINSQYGLTNSDQFDIIIPDLNHPELTESTKKYYSPFNQPWSTATPTTTP